MSEPAITLGVEEEYQILDAATGALTPAALRLVPLARQALGEAVEPELFQAQIEVHTETRTKLADVRADLTARRKAVIDAAARIGCQIAAAGTHPFSSWERQPLYPKPRYRNLIADGGQESRKRIVFGCHVHVGIPDQEAAIQTMNRARSWVGALIALAASSPFWLGEDTGWASHRTRLWSDWSMAGTPPYFDSRAHYDRAIAELIAAGRLRDATKLYWDIRPSARYATLEFRAMDVCPDVDDAVMIAGLVRALVRTCYLDAVAGRRHHPPSTELLDRARLAAARSGLDGELFNPCTGASEPAPAVLEAFLERLRPVLEDRGDWEEISQSVKRVLTDGNGARRQRATFAETGSAVAVGARVVKDTGEP